MVHLRFPCLCNICLIPGCKTLHRGDGGVPEWAASDLSRVAIQARTLSVHTQASQWLRGSFPATAPSRRPRDWPGSHLLHRYVHKRAVGTIMPASVIHMHSPVMFKCPSAVKWGHICGFASGSNTATCTMKASLWSKGSLCRNNRCFRPYWVDKRICIVLSS